MALSFNLLLILSCQVMMANMALLVQQIPENPNEETSEIIKFLKDGEKTIRISSAKEVVLVLGVTGSGKSTFTQVVTGNDEYLESIEVGEETGEYVILDKNNKVCNRTTDSCTTVPDLIVDQKTQVPFYDCPGFGDTRHIKHDLSVTYFIKKIIDSADAIKLVFTVSYPSVRVGVDRRNFMLLIKNALKMVKDVDKFKDSIALIVTKVDNISIQRKGKSMRVSDKSIINNIAAFLEEVKSNLQAKISQAESNPDAEMAKAIKFIDVLLTGSGESYPRIGIFRRPDDAGKLETPMMLENKKNLEKIIHQNLEFTHCDTDDFGYVVSADTVNQIYRIADQVNKKVGSDVRAIAEVMGEGFHLFERDVNDVETLYRKFHFGFEAMSNITNQPSADPQDFLVKIREAASVLDLDVPKSNVDSILHNDRFLKFVRVLSGMNVSNFLEWSEGLKDVVKSFEDSQKWYSFLMNLHTTLLSHDVQKHLSKNSTNMDILREYIRLYRDDDSAVKESLKLFSAQAFKDDSDKDYNHIKSAKLNSWKLKFLKDMLDFQVLTLCENNKLVVVGNYVHLSDVARKNCNNVKYVEIFALSKIFIDADFDRTGKKIQLSILSPTWEVIGSSKIVLDGQPGWDYIVAKADSGRWPGAAGSDGLPGQPGGASGNFLGFGWNCINCQYLTVSANGGRGGNGQDGGNGIDGKSGQRPPKYNHYRNTFNMGLVTVSHEDRGNSGQPGGDGGRGGGGGNGGHAGQITMVMFNTPETSSPKTETKDGDDGSPGVSGSAGSGGASEHLVESHTYILGMYAWSNGIVSRYLFSSADGSSSSELNYEGLKYSEPPVALVSPSHAINSYKAYLRENLDSSLSRINLEEFLGQLETSEEIRRLYDTLGLVHDLQSLENQFSVLRRRVPLLPYYKSLLDKIDAYAKDMPYSQIMGQQKKVLAFLYMSTLSKICTIDNNMNNDLVINVKDYFGMVVKDVNQLLKDFMVTKHRNDRRAMFQQVLTYRVKEAKEFIEHDITQEAHNILANLDDDIRKLVLETHHLQNITRQELKRLHEHVITRAVSSVVNVACRALDFFGGLGTAAEGLIESTSLISESLSFDNPDSPLKMIFDAIPNMLNDFFASFADYVKDKIKGFSNQLLDVDKILQGFGGKFAVLNETRTALLEAREEFSGDVEVFGSPDEELEKVDNKRNELVDLLQSQKNSMAKLLQGGPDLEKALEALDQSTQVLKLPAGVYNVFNENGVNAALSGFEENDKLKQLEEYEKRIYSVIIPLSEKLKDQFNEMDAFDGLSHAALDVGKWKVQNALMDVQTQISSLTEGFGVQGPIAASIEKLKFGISTMVQVYDRIQEYHDQAALADYMADMSSDQAKAIEVTDKKLSDSIDDLQVILKTNLILSEYEKAMSAFGQHVFPFAKAYMAEYDLPTPLKAENSTDDLISEAIYKINAIERKLIRNDLTINQALDNHVFPEVPFTSRSQHGPFYVWKYETSSSEITQLLQGKEVILHADIIKGLNYNSVKFNEIGIRFKFPGNQAAQIEFDSVMENYIVEMNHFGLSYYRCGTKFYVMTHDTQKITHSVNEDDRGKYYLPNSVYRKMSLNEPLLSPYTMWKVKLHSVNNSFDELAKFSGDIVDVALEGRGMFIDRAIDRKVCNDHLDHYYKMDETVTEVPEIEYKIGNVTSSPVVVVARRRRGVDSGEFLDYDGEDVGDDSGALNQFLHWFPGNAQVPPMENQLYQPVSAVDVVGQPEDGGEDVSNDSGALNQFLHWFPGNAQVPPMENQLYQRVSDVGQPDNGYAFDLFPDDTSEEPRFTEEGFDNAESSSHYPIDDSPRNLLLLDLFTRLQKQAEQAQNSHVDDGIVQNTVYRAYDPTNDKEVIIVQ